jgi:hypothetical protein
MDQEEVITHGQGSSLAIVDAETYQTFVGEKADHLDMMVHLQDQMDALHAFAWDVPSRPLRLRLVVTGDHRGMERITFSNPPPAAGGTVRTHGTLCLVGQDRLLDCARNPEHTLLAANRVPKENRPHLLKVPSGIFYFIAYYRFPFPNGAQPAYVTQPDALHDYTIFLHHYPHPAPRPAPVRLAGGLIPWAA